MQIIGFLPAPMVPFQLLMGWGIAMETHPDLELSGHRGITFLSNVQVSILLGFSELGQHWAGHSLRGWHRGQMTTLWRNFEHLQMCLCWSKLRTIVKATGWYLLNSLQVLWQWHFPLLPSSKAACGWAEGFCGLPETWHASQIRKYWLEFVVSFSYFRDNTFLSLVRNNF